MGLFCKPTRRRTTPLLYTWSRQRISPRPDIRDPNVDATAAAAARVSYRGSSSFSPSPGVRVSATARAERRGVRGEPSRYRAEGLAETFDGAGPSSGLGLRSHTRPPRRRREQKLYATSGVDDGCNGCDGCYLPERGFDQEAKVACCDGCCSPSFSTSAPCYCCYSGRRGDWCPDCEQAPSYDRGRIGSRLDRCCAAGVGCSGDACAYEAGLDCAGGCDCSAC
ncbi:hypothetical protein P168DRAFT_292715 [Aspergillus campestris IBT 28561]|uniref:Uncharacterized protein n=1 Tax=Aspergillus campestris (strain IBT 28561) TaxID=1392248 RepID=A0A2I1CVI0_ASPC2|nr:uncharacterized protein P168DRAFT_292715 [Aspergillus campestris IBT 28561]PKY01628.1 hypothetical protein P168DRAFT_292715 [Aspergillus campestris IBT 28561]